MKEAFVVNLENLLKMCLKKKNMFIGIGGCIYITPPLLEVGGGAGVHTVCIEIAETNLDDNNKNKPAAQAADAGPSR